ISDRNGPWLSERLVEHGVDAAMIQIVGDRADDLMRALRFMADAGMALIVTSGGLGPTADDLTAEIVGEVGGRGTVLGAELHEMWEKAVASEAFRSAITGATEYRRGIVRLYGIPESEIANTLRAAEEAGLDLSALEITTCLRRGEIEVATRYEPFASADYE